MNKTSEDSSGNPPKSSWLGRRTAIITALQLIAAIAIANWGVLPNPSLTLLYLVPIVIVGRYLEWWEICALGAGCAVLREYIAEPGRGEDAIVRVVTSFIAYSSTAFLVRLWHQHRLSSRDQCDRLTVETQQHKATEEQLRGILDASPAAILGIARDGKISLANASAHQMLRANTQPLLGESIDRYLPRFEQLCKTDHHDSGRKLIEYSAIRQDGAGFSADVWVSTCGIPSAPLIATLFDRSIQSPDPEVNALEMAARTAGLMTGAFRYHLGNLCGSFRLVSTALKRLPGVAEADEMAALGTLIENLEKLSGGGLQMPLEEEVSITSLRAVLDRLRTIMQPAFDDLQIQTGWQLQKRLPLVRAQHSVLFEVLLNLAWGAVRSLGHENRRALEITASAENHRAAVRFVYSGQLTGDPDYLFQPSHVDSAMALYVCRERLQSFGGSLRYDGSSGSIAFVVELQIAPDSDLAGYLEGVEKRRVAPGKHTQTLAFRGLGTASPQSSCLETHDHAAPYTRDRWAARQISLYIAQALG